MLLVVVLLLLLLHNISQQTIDIVCQGILLLLSLRVIIIILAGIRIAAIVMHGLAVIVIIGSSSLIGSESWSCLF